MGRVARVGAVVVVIVAALQAGAWPAGGAMVAGPPGLRADFDGDGFDDLAVGVPLEDLSGVVDAGVVNVLYGSADGLTGSGSQQLAQALPEPGDQLGWAAAAGDFNGDGFADLAVGAPAEDVGSTVDAGAVTPLCGFDGFVFSCGPEGTITQTNPERDDTAGVALAAGDFNNDDIPDLAVGAPGETVGAAADAGAVEVYAGVNTEPIPDSGRLLFQNAPGVPGTSETGDIFAVGLAASFAAHVF